MGLAHRGEHAVSKRLPLSFEVALTLITLATVVALAVSACSRDVTTVAKRDARPTSGRKEVRQPRRASPEKASLAAPLKAPAQVAATPSIGVGVQASGRPAQDAEVRPEKHRSESSSRAAVTTSARTGSPAAPKSVPARPAVEVAVYDVESGIKTLQMTDGTIREEAFDPATLSSIKAEKSRGTTRISIVNE